MLNFPFYKCFEPIFHKSALFFIYCREVQREGSQITMPDMEFTEEQVRNIWKRVLAEKDDPSGSFDPLLLPGPEKEYVCAGPDICPDARIETDCRAADRDTGYTGSLRDDITRVIEGQLEQCIFCRALSRMSPGRRAARALTLIANRDYSSAKKIASAYFMVSGDYFFPRRDRKPENVPYYRSSLRNAWKNEVSLTAQCTTASEKTEDVSLMKALLEGARGHAENAVELRRLIEQSLD